ncbi:hypothetical protein GX586_04350 [bacterium]|nr:hypothetical protein [bacterium]
MRTRIPLSWSVGFTKSPATPPRRFIPAAVPGAVQLDWARAEGWQDHFIGDNWKQYRWMEDVWWRYRATFDRPKLARGQRLFFVSKGIDYQFVIFINGAPVHEQEGMFTPVAIDITPFRADAIEILVMPAPKSFPEPDNRSQANQSCKPAVSYGWDFHPRLIPLGIWDETYLELRPAAHLDRPDLTYALNDTFDEARVSLCASVALPVRKGGNARGLRGCALRWKIVGPDGRAVFRRRVAAAPGAAVLSATVRNPRLWWPHDQGDQPLYTSVLELVGPGGAVIDAMEQRFGIRRVRLVMQPDAWSEPAVFPKTRSVPPITFEINGRRIFCKGSNWVSPDVFPGAITAGTHRALLEMVKKANMNMLRSWGGAIVQKDSFFELCDELGIMVWQEFPLSCNRYEGTHAYLRVLEQEARSIIRRIRHHPCLVIWCGGNELFNEWSGMTDQDYAFRLLNLVCYQLDRDRPFIPTAPLMGMAHGGYTFADRDGGEVYQVFRNAANTAYSECGCVATCSAAWLRRIVPEEDLEALDNASQPETEAGKALLRRVQWTQVPRYFPEARSLEELVERSQLLQAEGLKCIFEEARRQKPHCSLVLNWVLNEPCPRIVNCSIIGWPAEPKKACYAAGLSCRPVLSSARVPKFTWQPGERFEAEFWLLNDAPEAVPAGRVSAVLRFGGDEIAMGTWAHDGAAANTNLRGPALYAALPDDAAGLFELVLQYEGRPEWDSTYVFLARKNS